MSDSKTKDDLESNVFLSVKKNKLFLFLFLLGIMAIFYLCNLCSVHIGDRNETYSLLQIPIIIGACAGGPLIGVILALLGSAMNIASASLSNSYIDILSSPFASFDACGYHFSGNIVSIFICFLSNLALALVAGWIFKALKNRGQSIWKMILVVISAIFGILFFRVVVFFLFNSFFIIFLPNTPYSKVFVNYINSLNWLACVCEWTVNIAIDPFIVYAARTMMKLD